jgi:hypothetical protein
MGLILKPESCILSEIADWSYDSYEKIPENFNKWNLTESDYRNFNKTDWVVTEKIHGANLILPSRLYWAYRHYPFPIQPKGLSLNLLNQSTLRLLKVKSALSLRSRYPSLLKIADFIKRVTSPTPT